jgi:hypothetical protein
MEAPRHWRLKKMRYGLRAEVDLKGRVVGDVPTGIRDHVEQRAGESQFQHGVSAEALTLHALSNLEEVHDK